MLPESQTAVVARNETWTGQAATEPYEAGWAREAIIFVRALKAAGAAGRAHVELSPDGMNWVGGGDDVRAARRRPTRSPMPGSRSSATGCAFARSCRKAARSPSS